MDEVLNNCSNSPIQQTDDLCIGSVDDYDEMDIENYMLTQNEQDDDYVGEFPVLNSNPNNLETNLTTIDTSTHLYNTEQIQQNQIEQDGQENPMPHQIEDKPLMKLKEFYKLPNNLIISTNSNNLTAFVSSSTNDLNVSSQNTLTDDNNSTSSNTINSLNLAVDVCTATDPKPASTPPPATLDATQDFFNNIIDSTMATTSSSCSEILEQNIDHSPVEKKVLNQDNDEVGAFFKLMALKVRNANLTPVALTNLEIQILHVINSSLKQ